MCVCVCVVQHAQIRDYSDVFMFISLGDFVTASGWGSASPCLAELQAPRPVCLAFLLVRVKESIMCARFWSGRSLFVCCLFFWGRLMCARMRAPLSGRACVCLWVHIATHHVFFPRVCLFSCCRLCRECTNLIGFWE